MSSTESWGWDNKSNNNFLAQPKLQPETAKNEPTLFDSYMTHLEQP